MSASPELSLMRVLELLLAVVFVLLALGGVALTVFVVGGMTGFFWSEAPWLLVPLVLLIVGIGAYLLRANAKSQAPLPVPHPGPRMHAISPAGGIGLVFVLGYLVMFMGGLPGFQPIVLGLVGLGALLGALMIVTRRPRKPADSSLLRLR
jgi:hypothetical protein